MNQITQEKLLLINQIMDKLKINFPLISVPNPNVKKSDDSNYNFEEAKMVEWVNQLQDLDLKITLQAIDDLIKRPRQRQIDDLIKQPLVELRQMTHAMLEEIRIVNSIKIEQKPIKTSSPEYIDKLLKENGFR